MREGTAGTKRTQKIATTLFVPLSNWTDQTIRTMLVSPERFQKAKNRVEGMGGRIVRSGPRSGPPTTWWLTKTRTIRSRRLAIDGDEAGRGEDADAATLPRRMVSAERGAVGGKRGRAGSDGASALACRYAVL